jgi:hypothetical protein
VEKQVRNGCEEEARFGGRYAEFFGGGEACRNVTLVEGLTSGDMREGGVRRRWYVSSCRMEAEHVDNCDRYIFWKLADQRQIVFGSS